jgi:hypothetical protein
MMHRIWILLLAAGLVGLSPGCEQDRTLKPEGDTRYFFIPTSFSPDRNRTNDIYRVVKNQSLNFSLTSFEMTIYDQERQVYHCEADGKVCQWNGKYQGNGKTVEAGIYLVKIKFQLASEAQLRSLETRIEVIDYR